MLNKFRLPVNIFNHVSSKEISVWLLAFAIAQECVARDSSDVQCLKFRVYYIQGVSKPPHPQQILPRNNVLFEGVSHHHSVIYYS